VLDLQLRVAMGEDEDDAPRAIAVHPGGDEFVCATAKGCRSVLVAMVLLVHALLWCMRLTANRLEAVLHAFITTESTISTRA
jgi:hypothetical protein